MPLIEPGLEVCVERPVAYDKETRRTAAAAVPAAHVSKLLYRRAEPLFSTDCAAGRKREISPR